MVLVLTGEAYRFILRRTAEGLHYFYKLPLVGLQFFFSFFLVVLFAIEEVLLRKSGSAWYQIFGSFVMYGCLVQVVKGIGLLLLVVRFHEVKEELTEDAAYGPNVDGIVIIGVLKNQFRRHVDKCAHSRRLGELLLHRCGRVGGLGRDCPRQPKVAELDVAIDRHEYVAGLEVAVHHSARVYVVCGAECVVNNHFDVLLRHRNFVLVRNHGSQVLAVVLLHDDHMVLTLFLQDNRLIPCLGLLGIFSRGRHDDIEQFDGVDVAIQTGQMSHEF